MKKFASFVFVLLIALQLTSIAIRIVLSIFKAYPVNNLFLIDMIHFFSDDVILIVMASAIIYEITTPKKFAVGKLRENKVYEKLLSFRILCILGMMYCIASEIFTLYFSWDFYINLIASMAWISLLIQSIPFEENLSNISFKKGLIVSAKLILFIGIICVSVNTYTFFNEIRVYSKGNFLATQELLRSKIFMDKALTETYLNKETPLHIASKNESKRNINIILNSALDYEYINPQTNLFERVISAKDKNGKTPIDIIKEKEEKYKQIRYYNNLISQIEIMKLAKPIRDSNITDQQIIDMIEKNKIYVNTPLLDNEQTILKFAVESKRPNLVKYLISKGTDVNIIYNGSYYYYLSSSPIYRPTTVLHIPFINRILKKADKDLEKYMFTEEEAYNMCKILLENGASPNITANGTTVFLRACGRTSNPDLIKLFLSHGANIRLRNNKGNGPLENWYNSSDKEKNFDILDILIKAGADPHEKNPLTNKSFYETIKESTRSDEMTKKVSEYLDNYKK